jgi:hypothetical protein
MNDAADVVRALNGKFQMSWMKHSLHLGQAEATAFRDEMIGTFEAAAHDPAAFLASRAPRSRGGEEQPVQAGQAPPPSAAEGSVDSWAEAFDKASGMPRK